MITTRQTRLFRVPDLQSFQRVLASLTCQENPFGARSCAVLVPSHAAAGQLRDTFETLVLGTDRGRSTECALPLPDLLTRTDWYARLHERLRDAPPVLDEFEREVLMDTAAREAAAAGAPPPFTWRPGLIVEVVRFYDELQRLRKTVDDFERLLIADLAVDAESDRGAERLLRQTRFLVSTFRRYETRLSTMPSLDEHRLRQWLVDHPLSRAYTHIVLAVADRAAEPEGLWPADFDLLTRLPLLTRIDVVATEALLAAGFHQRLDQVLPGIEEERIAAQGLKTRLYEGDHSTGVETARAGELSEAGIIDERVSVEAGLQTRLLCQSLVPALVAPDADGGELYFRSRDREDELSDIVRRLKHSHDDRRSLSRTAILFRRPLPYIYLAHDVLASAGVPYQTQDALPLAAEPYAAAIDLVFDVVSSTFTRASTVALLRSPHFVFTRGDRPLDRRALAAFERRLSETGYLGGIDRLRDLLTEWTNPSPGSDVATTGLADVARVALAVADELAPLLEPAPASHHLERLRVFLRQHDCPPEFGDALGERQLRARASIHAAIESLREAHRQIDDRTIAFTEIAAAVRRWIEGQTFTPRTGSRGVHLVDARAARFGLFDEVSLVGLVDTEWPDRAPRNIFFPPFLLQPLGWPVEADRLAAARAAFRDLMRLARRQVSVSTFSLEDDTIVGPSVFLEDLEAVGLTVVRVRAGDRPRVFPDEAMSEDPVESAPLSAKAAVWLALRQSRTDQMAPMFHGTAAAYERPSYAVGALETYLECPFKFFAKHVLHLDEEQDDEEARRPRRQGIFLHRVFQAFFEEWSRMGHRAITLDRLPEARAIFARVVGALLAELPDAEAALERNRLFGSAAAEGLAEIVFRIEADSGAEVLERLLEHRLEGEFALQGPDGPRRVALTGIADRIDLLEDGTVRVIDYKSSRPPSAKRMLQLPVYSVCATQRLDGRHGRAWKVGEGGYIAFRDPRRFVPLADRGGLEPVLQEAQARLLQAIDDLQAGRFPPDPVEPFRCAFCAYSGVCRKDYVGDE